MVLDKQDQGGNTDRPPRAQHSVPIFAIYLSVPPSVVIAVTALCRALNLNDYFMRNADLARWWAIAVLASIASAIQIRIILKARKTPKARKPAEALAAIPVPDPSLTSMQAPQILDYRKRDSAGSPVILTVLTNVIFFGVALVALVIGFFGIIGLIASVFETAAAEADSHLMGAMMLEVGIWGFVRACQGFIPIGQKPEQNI